MSDSFVPNTRSVLSKPVHCLATGLGSGLLRPAPGTWGSLAAVLFFALFLRDLPLWSFLLIIVVGGAAGFWLCGKTSSDWGVHDHGAIVWDEWIGQWIALLGLAHLPWAWLLAFLYFRFFDIVKPGPIGWADKRFDGGLGIMLDDLIAGLAALLATHATVGLLGCVV